MTRLSHTAVGRPRAALALLGAALLALGLLGLDLESRLTPTTLYTPGTESADANRIYEAEFGDGITIPVLLVGPERALDRQGPALVRRLREQPDFRVLSAWDRGPAGEALRPEGGSALIIVAVDRRLEEAVDAGLRDVEREVRRSLRDPVRSHVTGLASIGLGVKDSSLSAVARAEKLAIPILIVVLLAVFRSVVAAIIPLVFGGAVVIAGNGALALLTRLTDVDAIAVSLASMMGLALGVDYSLLLVSRFREELAARGPAAAREAASATAASAGRTVVFAGAVLWAAMLVALAVAPGDLLASASFGVLVAVAMSVVCATIGIPAVLVLLGPNVDRLWIGGHRDARASAPVRAAMRVLARPLVPALLVLGVLLAGAVPALALRTGPPDVRMLPAGSQVRKDFEAVRDTMGAGWTTPFEVIVRVPEGAITERRRLLVLRDWQRRLARSPNVLGVVGPGAIAEQAPDARVTRTLAASGRTLARGRRDLARLRGGLDRAGDGVRRLREGLAQAAGASTRLAAGGAAARDGAARVRAGLAEAARGADALAEGLRAARAGGGRLARGAQETAAGAARLARELDATRGRVEAALPAARRLPEGLREGARDLARLREPAQRTEAELRAALKELDRFSLGRGDPRYDEAYTAVARALGAASGRHPLTGAPVAPGYDGLDASIARGAQGLETAAGAAAQLVAGTERLARGLAELSDGARELRAGAARLERGADRLRAGLRRLAAGGGRLHAGLADLHDGAGRLGGGISQLAAGAQRLGGGLDDGARRTETLAGGLDRGERGVRRSGRTLLRSDFSGLARSARRSPGLFESGYFTLAALDGAREDERSSASFAVSLDRGGRAGNVMVVPETGPNEPETAALGDRLAREADEVAERLGGEAAVGGAARFLDDYDRATAARFPLLVLGIVLASYLVLVVVFRSLVLPAIAVALNLVTVGAAFGLLALLFQGSDPPLGGAGFIDAVSTSGIFCVLFGLSIDYQVFLITRMREGWELTGSTTGAIAHGLERTASVVTGAALIMLGVFAAFALADVTSIRQFGLGLAVAVLIDATVVRLVLLPAAMRACGRWCWWLPAPLARRLPALQA
ncbi:MAG TPA: MMPL family transporter [Solirubrobacteraceae bacterium]|nr:MMPL family transporter [Solirubrobacteraceae bacterium]